MNKVMLTAVLLGNLIKAHVAGEIVAMLASGDVTSGARVGRLCVYGDTMEALTENRQRCRDAAAVFGVALRARPAIAVEHANDPFHQIAHYVAQLTVTYTEVQS